MNKALSIRSFMGAKNFNESRKFYADLGFGEFKISESMSYFSISDALGFYLQDYYVADWVNNSMIFLEVENADDYWKALQALHLDKKYPGVKLSAVKQEAWGKECFLHDPSGILWHIGAFNKG